MDCQKCGYKNEPGAEFCGSCGTFLEWAGETAADGSAVAAPAPDPVAVEPPLTSVAVEPPQASAAAQPPPAPRPSKPELVGPPCPVCSMPVPKSRTFCPSCGADTRAPRAAAYAAVVDAPPAARRLPSIGLGPIILGVAFVAVAVVAVVILPRVLGGGGPGSEATGRPVASASVTARPTDPAAASGSEAPSGDLAASEAPTGTPIPLGNEPPTGADAKAAIVSFLEEFDAAYRVGDSTFLLEHLDPAVFRAYSQAACRTSIESFAKADFATTVGSVSGPAVWTYKPTNGKSTIISVAYVVTGERTRAGKTTPLTMHLAFDAGSFTWFSGNC